MALNYISPGLGAVSAYQVAGVPFFNTQTVGAASSVDIQLPAVSKSIYVVNNSADDLRVGVTQAGVEGTNFLIVPGNSKTEVLDIKTVEIWLHAPVGAVEASVYASLTSIATNNLGGYSEPSAFVSGTIATPGV